MFESKKRLKQIEEEKQQLEETRQQLEIMKQQIETEKRELMFIKEQLEDSTPKVDISNIYVWKDKGVCSIVRLEVEKITGQNYRGRNIAGYHSTLIDIFTGNIVYQKNSARMMERKEVMIRSNLSDTYYSYFYPISNVDNNLLAYIDKKIPLYVLQQLYYKLNKVDVNAPVLKKEK